MVAGEGPWGGGKGGGRGRGGGGAGQSLHSPSPCGAWHRLIRQTCHLLLRSVSHLVADIHLSALYNQARWGKCDCEWLVGQASAADLPLARIVHAAMRCGSLSRSCCAPCHFAYAMLHRLQTCVTSYGMWINQFQLQTSRHAWLALRVQHLASDDGSVFVLIACAKRCCRINWHSQEDLWPPVKHICFGTCQSC